MIKKLSHVRLSNSNNYRHQKQFFHTMLSVLLKLGSAGILPIVMAIVGFSAMSSNGAVAAESDEKTQLDISLRLREALDTGKEVKSQEQGKPSISEVSLSAKPSEEDKSQEISPTPQQSVELAQIGDSLVSPSSGGNSQSDSLFGQQGESLFERQQSVPTAPNDQKTQAEPLNPLQENSTPARRERSRSEVQLDISPVGDPVVQADGRSTIQIRGQIINEKGEVIPKDVLVTLTSSAGEFIGSDQDPDAPGYQALVVNGEFIGTLQSGLKPQTVRIRAAVHEIKKPTSTLRQRERAIDGEILLDSTRDTTLFNNELIDEPIEAYTQVEFTTYLRPSLVTGIINLRIGARGTNFWGSRREFLDPDADDGTEVDLDSQIFATGKVGEWLFT
ncbi:hypothetical protein IQ247_15130 [Plectonema cf. radiosum LEGE 06105]|uniref:Uncharacterized protein n=1 Tax=Plectonema cf. radiosum LEGE 06105 TaxID=945769 RepID=A0A8J7FCZ1_9CYAN|nr:hypothetical protein [Plectonema radiosum]MBE9213983.1 hypothetical protein [Plectonema cf. radiosum LEGE 06105]